MWLAVFTAFVLLAGLGAEAQPVFTPAKPRADGVFYGDPHRRHRDSAREFLRQEEAQLAKWIRNNPERHEAQAGWQHEYTASKSGRFENWNPSTPAPPETQDSKLYGAWLAFVRHHNLRMILNATRLGLYERKPSYLVWAQSEIAKYGDAYARLPVSFASGRSKLFTRSLDEAIFAIGLSEALRNIGLAESGVRHEAENARLLRPMLANIMASLSPQIHNINLWRGAAAYALALRIGDRNAALSALNHVNKQLVGGVTPDGFWHETSLHYHYYSIDALLELIKAAWAEGVPDDASGALEYAVKMLNAAGELRFSNGDGPVINDSKPTSVVPPAATLRRMHPVVLCVSGCMAQGRVGWESVIFPYTHPSDAPNPRAGWSKRTIFKDLPGILTVVAASEGWELHLRYGQNTRGHAHQEGLSVELMHEGNWLFRDAGTVAYSSTLHQEYFKQAWAQNVPILNRKGQLPWPSVGRGQASPQTSTVTAAFDDYSQGYAVERSLAIDGNQLIDKVTATHPKSSAPPDRLGVLYNTRCHVEAGPGPLHSRNPAPHLSKHLVPVLNFAPEASGFVATLVCNGGRYYLYAEGKHGIDAYIYSAPDSIPPYSRSAVFIETPSSHAVKITISTEPLGRKNVRPDLED